MSDTEKSPEAAAFAERYIVEVPMAQAAKAIAQGEITALALMQGLLVRISTVDRQLRSILAFNPLAVQAAMDADYIRSSHLPLGTLHGVPILIKDNIDTRGIATTAGSLALKDNIPLLDAPLVTRLYNAGAIVLGKTNLSEWANIRSRMSSSGWSAVGGLTHNPYALAHSAGGSSSGSGAAVAASLAFAAIGTETDGSITNPASFNGLVGLKPTVGLVPRTGIVPISHSQDTPGPMTRTVTDAAIVLTAIAGSDARDPATSEADQHYTDYAKGLDGGALKGARLAVLRAGARRFAPETLAVFQTALDTLKAQGAEIIEIDGAARTPVLQGGLVVLLTELKTDLNAYLAEANPNVRTRTLTELIAFNKAQAQREMPFFGQDLFELAETLPGPDDPFYRQVLEAGRRGAGPEGIDRLLRETKAVALLSPTNDAANRITLGQGDHFGGSVSTLPATAGYPHLTVPMGQVNGLPVGLSFIGAAWSEQRLLSLGYGFEQAAQARKPPTYPTMIGSQ